jgi:hypothetical protein
VVQGYDPDYDILLNNSSDDCQFTTVQLLVCVDTASSSGSSSSSSGTTEPSGWVDAANMHLCQGTILQLSVIG